MQTIQEAAKNIADRIHKAGKKESVLGGYVYDKTKSGMTAFSICKSFADIIADELEKADPKGFTLKNSEGIIDMIARLINKKAAELASEGMVTDEEEAEKIFKYTENYQNEMMEGIRSFLAIYKKKAIEAKIESEAEAEKEKEEKLKEEMLRRQRQALKGPGM